MFKRLYAVDDQGSLLFIRDICHRLQSALCQQIHAYQIEAVLHLVLTAGETYRGKNSFIYFIICFTNDHFRHFKRNLKF